MGLPVQAGRPAASARGIARLAASLMGDEKTSILIVDDLPEKLLVFQTILEELGQNLVMVRSGSEALKEILHREFAVILLDVNMPDIDGLETAKLIRQYKRSAHTPIIFITAYADELQTAQGYSLGAVDPGERLACSPAARRAAHARRAGAGASRGVPGPRAARPGDPRRAGGARGDRARQRPPVSQPAARDRALQGGGGEPAGCEPAQG